MVEWSGDCPGCGEHVSGAVDEVQLLRAWRALIDPDDPDNYADICDFKLRWRGGGNGQYVATVFCPWAETIVHACPSSDEVHETADRPPLDEWHLADAWIRECPGCGLRFVVVPADGERRVIRWSDEDGSRRIYGPYDVVFERSGDGRYVAHAYEGNVLVRSALHLCRHGNGGEAGDLEPLRPVPPSRGTTEVREP